MMIEKRRQSSQDLKTGLNAEEQHMEGPIKIATVA